MARLLCPAVRAGVVLATALTCITGCGGPRTADVHGKVTYRGKTVVYGSVVVFGSDQMPYYGTIRLDGTFTVKKVPVGQVRLGVNSPDPYYERPLPADVKAEAEERQRRAGLEPPVKPPKGQWFTIPGRFADPRTSGLTGEVTAPETTINLALD